MQKRIILKVAWYLVIVQKYENTLNGTAIPRTEEARMVEPLRKTVLWVSQTTRSGWMSLVNRRHRPEREKHRPALSTSCPAALMANGTRYSKLVSPNRFIEADKLTITTDGDLIRWRLVVAMSATLLMDLHISVDLWLNFGIGFSVLLIENETWFLLCHSTGWKTIAATHIFKLMAAVIRMAALYPRWCCKKVMNSGKDNMLTEDPTDMSVLAMFLRREK